MNAEISKAIARELAGLHGPDRRAAYSKAARKVFVASGLRSDGRSRAAQKPCGCRSGYCLKCMKPGSSHYYSAERVAQFHADYMAGMSFSAVERKYGLPAKGLKNVFVRRGLEIRPLTVRLPKRDPVTGKIIPLKPHTWEEIRELARGLNSRSGRYLKAIKVPQPLHQEWRKQTMEWRMKVLAILREEVKVLNPRPETPFSSNVKPWEYGTPEAMEIARRENAGLCSRKFKARIWIGSSGLIYKGQLYFWVGHNRRASESTGYVGNHLPKRLLHHVIWEESNGQRVPEKHTVIFRDGNKNNFNPDNLALRSMADCALMNSVVERLKRDPKNPQLLAKQKLRVDRIITTRSANRTRKSRVQTAALLQSFQNPTSGGIIAALKRRPK